MLIVIAEGRLRAADRERFEAMAKTMITASRQEAGCLAYWYAFDLLEPDRLRVNEIWRDKAALEFHFTTAHLRAFSQGVAALKPEHLAVKVYDLGAEGKMPR